MNKSLVLYDGECGLCNSGVIFIYKRDPEKQFRFISMQSPRGKELLKQYGFHEDFSSTMLLIKNDKAYVRSSAALRIARMLKGGWPAFYAFMAVPAFIRDFFYNFLARNRRLFFGKKVACEILPAEAFRED